MPSAVFAATFQKKGTGDFGSRNRDNGAAPDHATIHEPNYKLRWEPGK
jgi:hypothetical protein